MSLIYSLKMLISKTLVGNTKQFWNGNLEKHILIEQAIVYLQGLEVGARDC